MIKICTVLKKRQEIRKRHRLIDGEGEDHMEKTRN